jgi:hypothetical protein
MLPMVNFIGIGAQKSGTSWVYACLYEHPEICAPVKEIHFFSRPRFAKGLAWYESHFSKCERGKVCGEFSTSYLYATEAPARIREAYPSVKLIAILREPIARAYSQYGNSLKSGEISMDTSFETFVTHEPSCLGQGRYHEQLKRYHSLFPKEQLLVLIYEDIARDPRAFMQKIYRYLGVDDSFVPPSLYSQINIARKPRMVLVDRVMHHVAENLRRAGLDRLVHRIKTSGVTDWIRQKNTQSIPKQEGQTFDRSKFVHYFKDDVTKLSEYLKRDMNNEWNI